jgi:hypothetical protein
VKRVDFLGPAGIGKTFLLNALTAHLPSGFLTEDHAKVEAARIILRSKSTPAGWLGRTLLDQPASRGIRHAVARAVFDEYAQASYIDCPLEHSSFFNAVLECAARAGKPSVLKVQAVARVHRSLRELTAFEALLPINTTVISDEPLSKKIYSFCSMHEADTVDIVRLYASAMPLPDLLVQAYCDVHTTMERVTKRSRTEGKTVYNHKLTCPRDLEKMIERQQMVSDVICQVLRKRGVPSININTEANVEDNVRTFVSGLENFRFRNIFPAR